MHEKGKRNAQRCPHHRAWGWRRFQPQWLRRSPLSCDELCPRQHLQSKTPPTHPASPHKHGKSEQALPRHLSLHLKGPQVCPPSPFLNQRFAASQSCTLKGEGWCHLRKKRPSRGLKCCHMEKGHQRMRQPGQHPQACWLPSCTPAQWWGRQRAHCCYKRPAQSTAWGGMPRLDKSTLVRRACHWACWSQQCSHFQGARRRGGTAKAP